MSRAERDRAYREANRERIAEFRRVYCEANREQIAEYQRAYREANRERIAEKQRAYREANRERIAENRRVYQEANRERIAEYERALREAVSGDRNWQPWTAAENAIAMRDDIKVIEIAALIRRSVYAVQSRRTAVRKKEMA